MEKKQTAPPVTGKTTTAVILMREFTDDNREKREYVSVEIPDLFDDEDFRDIGICPKWDDQNSVFKYYAKKALRSTDRIEFPIELKVGTYHSDKKRKDVTYPALIGKNPFNGKELEFKIKGKDNSAVFNELARNFLGLSADDQSETHRETDDDSPL